VRSPHGQLYVGTSGFAYPDWSPLFYPPGTRSSELLRTYASRLPAVELNNTFYQQPKPDKIAAWLAATASEFRFVVKAQRGASMRAFGADAASSLEWLTAPYRLFGERLGAVLFRVPSPVKRDDERLRTMLAAWPADIPLVMEFQDPSWQADEGFHLLRSHGAALCATDLDDEPEPDLRLTGRFTYLRLRRTDYSDADLERWADRLSAFLDDGVDCYVFFRHDETGESALRAQALAAILAIAR
jgi:uncharacterized protein YecE (DUF72 family)